ncbi:Asp-tRNA(Asn)/Glu-tRNA(Gln) amidotransferase A subunit family amidase [Bradyrhizobium sp. USDA 4461]
MMDPCTLSAVEAVQRMRSGRLSARDLLESCLQRIADRDHIVRAFSYFDPEAIADVVPLEGPLGGIPLGIKDIFDTADMPTAYGSPIWDNWRPKADAASVIRAKRAGALVLGKTVTAEFAIRTPGPTTNPHNARHTPGGSSSGSAAGVADFFFPLALGTQAMGSIIKPAAYCGVVGFKPTFGVLPRAGTKCPADSLDTVGILARDVDDCRLLFTAMLGLNTEIRSNTIDRLPRIGVAKTFIWPKASAAVREMLDRIAVSLSRAGAIVADYDLPAEYEDLSSAFPTVLNYEANQALAWETQSHAVQISDALRSQLKAGSQIGSEQYAEAIKSVSGLRQRFSDDLGDFDVLITPAATGEAPEGLTETGDSSFNYVWTALHVPCVTIPAGNGSNNLPLGLQIVARKGSDLHLLDCARWIAAHI